MDAVLCACIDFEAAAALDRQIVLCMKHGKCRLFCGRGLGAVRENIGLVFHEIHRGILCVLDHNARRAGIFHFHAVEIQLDRFCIHAFIRDIDNHLAAVELAVDIINAGSGDRRCIA